MDWGKTNNIDQSTIDTMCMEFQKQTFYDAKRLIGEVNWYLMNTENNYGVVDHDGTPTYEPPKDFTPYIDAVLAAKIFGWTVDEDKLQDHNPGSTYDETIWGDQAQADNGGKEGYVKISRDGNVAEIHTHNEHRLSKPQITINGETQDMEAKVYDGKTYVSYTFGKKIAELCNYDIKPVKMSDLSPERSYQKSIFGNWANISTWPLGLQIVLICIAVLIFAALVYSVFYFIKNRKAK